MLVPTHLHWKRAPPRSGSEIVTRWTLCRRNPEPFARRSPHCRSVETALPPNPLPELPPLDFESDEPTQQLSQETILAQALEALFDEPFDFATTRSDPPSC